MFNEPYLIMLDQNISSQPVIGEIRGNRLTSYRVPTKGMRENSQSTRFTLSNVSLTGPANNTRQKCETQEALKEIARNRIESIVRNLHTQWRPPSPSPSYDSTLHKTSLSRSADLRSPSLIVRSSRRHTTSGSSTDLLDTPQSQQHEIRKLFLKL